MIQFFRFFSFRKIFNLFLGKDDILDIYEVKKKFNKKISEEIKKVLVDQIIIRIDLVYSDFLFPNI